MVLDASAAVQLVLALPGWGEVEGRLRDHRRSVHAPHLLYVEVAQAIRRIEASGAIGAGQAREALVDLGALDVTAHPHDWLLPRIWDLRHSLTAYDAAYVALAEVLAAPLLTFDARLASASGHDATIDLLAAP